MLHLKIITVTFYTKILTIVIKQKITMEWRFTQAVISEKMMADAAAEEISAVKRSIGSTTGRAAIIHYANQPARPLWLLRRRPNFTSSYSGVYACLA